MWLISGSPVWPVPRIPVCNALSLVLQADVSALHAARRSLFLHSNKRRRSHTAQKRRVFDLLCVSCKHDRDLQRSAACNR